MILNAIILTNSERIEYLKKLILNLEFNDLNKIFIIQNGDIDNKDLLDLASKKPNITLIPKYLNTGGTSGMFFLIKFLKKNFQEIKNQYFIILDDDLILETNFQKKLELTINYLINSITDHKFIILSHRVNRAEWTNQLKYGLLNYDLTDSVFNWSITKLIVNKFFKKKPTIADQGRVLICECDKAHFGGVIIRSNELKYLDLPEIGYQLYADDHNLFRKLIKKGIPIYQSFILKIYDQDVINPVSQKSDKVNNQIQNIEFKGLNSLFHPFTDETKLFYQCRNHFLESINLKKTWFFYFNFIFYVFLNTSQAIWKTLDVYFVSKRLFLLYSSIKSSKYLKKNLNENANYK